MSGYNYVRFVYGPSGAYANVESIALDAIRVYPATPAPTPQPSISQLPTPVPTTFAPTTSPGPTSLPSSLPTPKPTTLTSGFESYSSNSDVSGNGLWQTGVIYNAFIVQSGSTGSSGTGPSSAYDGSYYAYCETSSPNSPGVYFDLQTSEFMNGISGVSFYYSAYGTTIGYLYLQGSADANSWNTVQFWSGNYGSSWQFASVDLSGYTYLRFLYVSGTSFAGDLALDEITIAGAPTSAPTMTLSPPYPLCQPSSPPRCQPPSASVPNLQAAKVGRTSAATVRLGTLGLSAQSAPTSITRSQATLPARFALPNFLFDLNKWFIFRCWLLFFSIATKRVRTRRVSSSCQHYY